MSQESEPRIFISFSSIDGAIVDALIQLLVFSLTGLDRKDVLCTRTPTTGLSSGAWISRRLVSSINTADAFIAVVSESYLSSRYSMFELGVRLSTPGSRFSAVYLPGIDPENMGEVFAGMHLLSLMDEDAVQKLLEEVESASPKWTHHPSIRDIHRFCEQAKGHPPNPIERWRSKLVRYQEGHVFLNAYGLLRNPTKRRLFQDFHPAGPNIQPVQYLWADPRLSNSIRAQLEVSDRPSDSFLRVFFHHKPYSFGCNFAVRPLNRQTLLAEHARALTISARVPPESQMREIGIRLRLVNGYMQHWQSTAAEILRIHGERFADFSIDLDPACWALFDSDGTGKAGPTNGADFSLISSVVLALGGYEYMAAEPTPGEGVLDIRSIEIK